MQKVTTLFTFFILLSQGLFAQPFFPADGIIYQESTVPRVDIEVHPDTLTWLYENVESDIEYHARFINSYNNTKDTVEKIGFRLRGNTSRQSAKKSFKISFNTFEKGKKYQGVEKMNLNGEHNDPAIIRSHMAWRLFEQLRVPGSRSNHVQVYINDEYFGLYANIEHIDEEFAESRFGSKTGNLYKCLYPANLTYLGNNVNQYKENGYTLKTNEETGDFADIIQLIKIINDYDASEFPEQLEPFFNVNGFIRYLAVEIFTGHWDAVSFNRNNFYLYNNPLNEKIEFIPYDVDNTYGIDWFGIDWAYRDIYQWYSNDNGSPLTKKIFENQVYTDRFSFFMHELISNYSHPDTIFPYIDELKNKISSYAENDPFRPLDYGWTYEDFLQSFDNFNDQHVKYGLKEYITERVNSINNQLQLNPIAPIIENVFHNFPALNQPIKIKADITDDEPGTVTTLYYKIDEDTFASIIMNIETDPEHTANLPAVTEPSVISYYIESLDATGKTTREPFSGEYKINVGISNTTLVINEFMASNGNTIRDNYGETADWIEIKNTGTESINIGGKYLTDDLTDKTKWALPNVTLEPGGFFIVWADDETNEGANHANFKLSSSGEPIGLFESYQYNFTAIDTLHYGVQITDISWGRLANGTLSELDFITPFGENDDNQLAYITFTYNMNKQVQDNNFSITDDFIDIAGTFNDWAGGVNIFDGNEDGILRATLFNFTADQNIEFKARINGDWGTAEFAELGGDGNRSYTVQSGHNIIDLWYDDEETSVQPLWASKSIEVFPNPAYSGTPVKIESNALISEITLFNLNGKVVHKTTASSQNIEINTAKLPSGLYVMSILDETQTVTTKKIMIY